MNFDNPNQTNNKTINQNQSSQDWGPGEYTSMNFIGTVVLILQVPPVAKFGPQEFFISKKF